MEICEEVDFAPYNWYQTFADSLAFSSGDSPFDPIVALNQDPIMTPARLFVRMMIERACKVAPSKCIKTRFSGNASALETIDKCRRPRRQQIVCGYSATTAS